ncbi:MAG: aminoacyl-histidine dipeptidase [Planctomycetota bacterium]|nr:aminoacyl-histidine dipeptidase [Planctomycetota bacterium]
MSEKTVSSPLESLEPQAVWRFFAAMTEVPRPSKSEEKIRAHVRATAEALGFPSRRDETGNIVIEAPATPGHENAPVTVLQGHLDMVGEKNAEVKHDFERDPIRPVIDTDAETGEPIVCAEGTTLGADNGIGVAMALAAASSPDVVHGPLEILCTSNEEMGMTGANALDAGFFRGRRMLNLDSEEDDAIYIGCAGGTDVELIWELPAAAPADVTDTCRVKVGGLRGGHSGDEIHLNRANAVKLLAQVLGAELDLPLRLVDITGGSKRNAIPREAGATVAGPAGTIDALRNAAGEAQARAVRAHGEKNCRITVDAIDGRDASVGSAEDSRRLLKGLIALPSGVAAIVPDIPGLVQTSNNISTIDTRREESGDGIRVQVGCLARSSSADDMQMIVWQLAAIGRLGGATVEIGNSYPGWQPDLESPLLATARRIYAELFETEPGVAAIHAGLECGIIGRRIGGMDMISIGPRIEGAHSPEERVYIASVERSYRFLIALLAELARG